MNSIASYISINNSVSIELKEKGSKFIALALKVSSEDEVKQTLTNWKVIHPNATHICYAYRLGVQGERYRANDDGEPNNSAGAPILGQIISANLTNVLVAVVRYYGGTKLGVGGLISAYKESAKLVLDQAEKIEYQLKNYFEVNCSYEEMPFILAVLKKNRIEIVSKELTDECRLIVELEIEDKNDIFTLLSRFQNTEIKFQEIR